LTVVVAVDEIGILVSLGCEAIVEIERKAKSPRGEPNVAWVSGLNTVPD